MPQRISKKTLYLNADRSKLVAEDDPDAAFLFVREGSAVDESRVAELEKRGVKVNLTTDDNPDFDARAAHEAQYGPPNAQRDAELKARMAAPANKARTAAADTKANKE